MPVRAVSSMARRGLSRRTTSNVWEGIAEPRDPTTSETPAATASLSGRSRSNGQQIDYPCNGQPVATAQFPEGRRRGRRRRARFPRSSRVAACAADKPTVVNSIRSLSNPYHATWNKGGAAFAKSVGAEYVTLVTEGNSEKGIADIKAILAKTGGNCVINVDPNDSPDARPIVEAAKAAGAYVVTQWNKPADLHPWDFDPNYVAHISFSGVPYGKAMAEALIKAMGGKGGIVALGGIESNVPAIERKAGLKEALEANPGRQAARHAGRQLVGDRGAGEDQRLADPVRRRDRRHLGGQRRHGARRGRGAARRRPRRQGAGHRHRRHPARGRSDPQGRDGRHRGLGSVLAGRHGPGDRLPRQDGQVRSRRRSRRSTASSTAPASSSPRENAQAFYDSNIKAEPPLDWDDIWGRASGQIQYTS